jgi:hypothetical protein
MTKRVHQYFAFVFLYSGLLAHPALGVGNDKPVKQTAAAAPCTSPARFFLGTVYAPPISRSAAVGRLGTTFRFSKIPRKCGKSAIVRD